MQHRFLTDKSLLAEGRAAGWYVDRPRPFAEPGIEPHYGPDRGFELERVDLDLRIDPELRALQGVARLHIRPTAAGLGELRFDMDELEVDSVSTASGRELAWRGVSGGLVVLGVDGPETIVVRYHGSPRLGLYFVGPEPSAPDRGHQAWTQCQDEDAHHVFPCFDHPSVKHPMRIRVTAPRRFTVVANGELVERRDAGEGWTCWAWEQREPIPAYLFTVVVAELRELHLAAGDLPLRCLVPPSAPEDQVRRAFGDTPEMIAMLEDLCGQPFPWPRYDQVVVHDFVFGGMENAGATTLTDLVLADQGAAACWDPRELVVHELAHQWFGDLVTCRDWSQAWLNEGWATYAEVLWQERTAGQGAAAWYAWKLAGAWLHEAGRRYSRPIVDYRFREPIDLFDRHLYEKAGCVLHTLRRELGERGFRAGVRAYLAGHRHGSVHTRDFQDAMERATGRNLDLFFQQWIHSPGAPDLAVRLAHEEGLLQVTVEQKQSGEGVPQAFHFGLRLELAGAEGVSSVVLPVRERSRTWAIPMAQPPAHVRVDPGFSVLARLAIEAPRPWLVAALREDPCPVGRIRAGEALAEERSPEAVTALAAALAGDADWRVRAEMARLLGVVKGAAARQALLSALSAEQEARVLLAVVKALCSFRDEEVAERLAAVVGAETRYPAVRGEAAAVLGRMRSKLAVDACRALLGQPSWGETLSSRALQGLGATRDPDVLDTLLEWTGDTRPQRARAAAAGALGQLADEVPGARLAAVDRLLELAEGAPFRVALAAVAALGRARDARALGVLERLHRGGGDGRLKRMAWEAIQDIREGRATEEALGALRRQLDEVQSRQVKLRERVDRLEPRP